MALIEDMFKGNLATGLAVGVGTVLLGPALIQTVGRTLRGIILEFSGTGIAAWDYPGVTALSSRRTRAGAFLRIRGKRPLIGTYPISGAKNAALPLMVCSLLTPQPVGLRNVPDSLDVAVLATLIQRLGATVQRDNAKSGSSLEISADRIDHTHIDGELVTRMRASILLLGAFLARSGQATLPMPGGDAIGLRSIDFHIAGLRAMGASISLDRASSRAKTQTTDAAGYPPGRWAVYWVRVGLTARRSKAFCWIGVSLG